MKNKICGMCGAALVKNKCRPPECGTTEGIMMVCSVDSTHNIERPLINTIAVFTNNYITAKNSLHLPNEIIAINNLLRLVSNLPQLEYEKFVEKQKE